MFTPTLAITSAPDEAAAKQTFADKFRSPRPWGYRRLSQFKTVNGYRYQLHATRGWKCVGRAKGGAA